jgi:hypothetical protein
MTILTGNGEFGVALCKALGIDGQSVRSIELRAVDEIVTSRSPQEPSG